MKKRVFIGGILATLLLGSIYFLLPKIEGVININPPSRNPINEIKDGTTETTEESTVKTTPQPRWEYDDYEIVSVPYNLYVEYSENDPKKIYRYTGGNVSKTGMMYFIMNRLDTEPLEPELNYKMDLLDLKNKKIIEKDVDVVKWPNYNTNRIDFESDKLTEDIGFVIKDLKMSPGLKLLFYEGDEYVPPTPR